MFVCFYAFWAWRWKLHQVAHKSTSDEKFNILRVFHILNDFSKVFSWVKYQQGIMNKGNISYIGQSCRVMTTMKEKIFRSK